MVFFSISLLLGVLIGFIISLILSFFKKTAKKPQKTTDIKPRINRFKESNWADILRHQLDEKCHELETQRIRIRTLEENHKSNLFLIDDLEKQNSFLKYTLNSEKRNFLDLQRNSREMEKESVEKNSQLNQSLTIIENLKLKNNHLIEEKQKLEQENQEILAHMDRINQKMTRDYHRQKQEYDAELIQLRDHIRQLEDELETSQKYANEIIVGINEEKTQLRKECQELHDQIISLSSQIEFTSQEKYFFETRSVGKTSCPHKDNMHGNYTEVILNSTELDFYPQEQKEILLDILREYATQIGKSRDRRHHIIQSIMENNNRSNHRDNFLWELEDILKKSNKISPREFVRLEKAGFHVAHGKNHIKIVFHGDSRYNESLHKTGSDYRGGKNALERIKRRFF